MPVTGRTQPELTPGKRQKTCMSAARVNTYSGLFKKISVTHGIHTVVSWQSIIFFLQWTHIFINVIPAKARGVFCAFNIYQAFYICIYRPVGITLYATIITHWVFYQNFISYRYWMNVTFSHRPHIGSCNDCNDFIRCTSLCRHEEEGFQLPAPF